MGCPKMSPGPRGLTAFPGGPPLAWQIHDAITHAQGGLLAPQPLTVLQTACHEQRPERVQDSVSHSPEHRRTTPVCARNRATRSYHALASRTTGGDRRSRFLPRNGLPFLCRKTAHRGFHDRAAEGANAVCPGLLPLWESMACAASSVLNQCPVP